MEHFLKKTTSVTSSMNNSGESPSDVQSPPLLADRLTGSITSNSTNNVERRATSLFPSSYHSQMKSSISAASNLTNPISSLASSNKTTHSTKESLDDKEAILQQLQNSESSTKTGANKETKEKAYTEIESIAVPKYSQPKQKHQNRRKKENIRSNKSGQSSDEGDESSTSTGSDSCTNSSIDCAKLDFEEEVVGGETGYDEGKHTRLCKHIQ